ncbi:SRPBCC family protein [Sulfobacillus thermosulfidooxidans]|uniref:SRPBCC family protein n=1 Tax=Sulfobacillus thermosulfidooxidans TaxID=28034 RepID=UPI0006B48164|nr:SRPBCC family protein [Sulfobacillus thermosulfidooxidans]
MEARRELGINQSATAVWQHVANVSEWIQWNGAIRAMKRTFGSQDDIWMIRLTGVGWVTVAIHADDQNRRLCYRMTGKGAIELGQLTVCSEGNTTCRVDYRVRYGGWAAWWRPLRHTVAWRLMRLKEWSETGQIRNRWSLETFQR